MFREKVPRLELNENNKLTPNFRLKEFCVSKDHLHLVEGLYLSVDQVTENLFMLCHNLLQPVRDEFDLMMHIISGYRNTALNNAVGSGDYSSHLKGKAVDFYIDDTETLLVMFEWIKRELDGRYGELLLYKHKDGTPNFIHVASPEWGRGVKIDDEVI